MPQYKTSSLHTITSKSTNRLKTVVHIVIERNLQCCISCNHFAEFRTWYPKWCWVFNLSVRKLLVKVLVNGSHTSSPWIRDVGLSMKVQELKHCLQPKCCKTLQNIKQIPKKLQTYEYEYIKRAMAQPRCFFERPDRIMYHLLGRAQAVLKLGSGTCVSAQLAP